MAILASPAPAQDTTPASDIIRSFATEAALQRPFSADDAALLDEIERGCFQYLWNEVGEPSLLAKDRRYAQVASVAGVGFQLAALPIGVERGWITREQAEERALAILRSLDRDDIRRHGFYLHFVDAKDAGVYEPFHNEVSTVDTALLLAGALAAGQYFGRDIAERVDRLAAAANWSEYVDPATGFVRFGWLPADNLNVAGAGDFLQHAWRLATDEERIIYFLAVGAPNADFAVEPRRYYELERHVERHGDMPPYVVSWDGTMFQYLYSHAYIDFRRFAADDPSLFGVEAPRVDWVENSRRATLTHRQRCIEAAVEIPSFAADRWGVSPCMALDPTGQPAYIVQDVEPNLTNRDEWHGGWIAPYAAAGALMFAPEESLAALRAFRSLKDADGQPLAWRDPAPGGYGFEESFSLAQPQPANAAGGQPPPAPATCDDHVAIDVGVMLVAIENARTGLIWRLFMDHPVAQRAVERLQFVEFHKDQDSPQRTQRAQRAEE
jgi:hypothetical protein